MWKRRAGLLITTAVALLLTVGGNRSRITAEGGRPLASSPLALSPDGTKLLVANPDSGTLSIVAVATRELLEEITVGANPRSVAISPDGLRAFITLFDDEALVALPLEGKEPLVRVAIGSEPFGVIASGSGRLYVSVSGSDRVEVLDTSTLQSVGSVVTQPQPRGLALSSDESTLFVTHFLNGRVSVIDTATLEVVRVISTGADSNLSESLILDEERKIAWAPQTRSNANNPALLFDTTLFPIVSAIDLTNHANDNRRRIAIDIADRPVNMPSGIALSSKGILWIVNSGSNDVSAIDLSRGFAVAHIEVGDNPRGIALAPDEPLAFVDNALAGTVSVIDTERLLVVDEIRVTTLPLPPDILRGKILFHSSSLNSLAKDQWISCAACHPDGRADGRTWFFRDGPRNTPTLVGVGETGPWHWSGDLDELADVESTIRIVQAGTGLAPGESNCTPACDQAPPNGGRSEDLDALAVFMRTIRTMGRSPELRASGSLTPAASRGRDLFLSDAAGCAGCHVPPLFFDGRRHDVGTGRKSALERKGTSFDTPSLRFLFATAPYLHDGSAPTLREVLTSENPDDRHGKTSHLTDGELDDLVRFLRSIPYETARSRAVRRGP
ncbi:MAG TPA: hypothetical protein VMT00_14365 [Thermoanaerobaculia bacterium]|nr:hypothetical protein [Thermoanaerobaculia bacterium]